MKQIWFRKSWWLYLPVHAMGILITLGAISFMVAVCMTVFKNVHYVNDGMFQVFIYGTCTGFWWKWIAEKTSE